MGGNWWDNVGSWLTDFVDNWKKGYEELDRANFGGGLPFGYETPQETPISHGLEESWQQAWEPTNPEGDYLSSGIRDTDVLGGISRVGELAYNIMIQPSRRVVEPFWGAAQYENPTEVKYRQEGRPDTDFWQEMGDVVTGGPIKTLLGTPMSAWQKGWEAVTGTPKQQEAGRQKFKELSTLSQLGSIPLDPTNYIPGLQIGKGKRALEVAKAIKPIGKFSTIERLAGSVANVGGKSADEILAMTASELRTPNVLSRTLGKVPLVGKPLAHLTDLTPAARVAEDLAATTDQISGRINNLVTAAKETGDIDLKAVDAVFEGMTDIAPEALATSKGAPSALVARQALTGATGNATKMWADAEAGIENLKVLQAKRAAGETVDATLMAQAEKAVKLAPKNKMETAARAGSELIDQAAKTLAEAHGLKLDKSGNVVIGKLDTIINAQKNILGVAFLGLNPNYPVQNFGNNVLMTILSGYNPFSRPGSAERTLIEEGFGVISPSRAKAGYGMADLQNPKGPIMGLAVKAEKWASENIWTQAFAKYVGQARNLLLPQDILGPQMRAALGASDPRLGKWIDDIVRNGANSPAEAIKKINALPGFDASKALPDVISLLSKEITDDPALFAFFKTHIAPWLDPKIKEANTFEEIQAVVAEARGKLDEWEKLLRGTGDAQGSLLKFVDDYTAARSAAMKKGVEIRGAGGAAGEIADVWDEARTAMGGLLDGLASSLKGKVPDAQVQKAVDSFTVWQNGAKAFQEAVQKIAVGPAGDDARQVLGAAYTKKMKPIVTKANRQVYELMQSVFDVEHMPVEKKTLWSNYWNKAFKAIPGEEDLQKVYGASLKGVTDPAKRQAISDAYHTKRQGLWEAWNKEAEGMRRELFGDMGPPAPKAARPPVAGPVPLAPKMPLPQGPSAAAVPNLYKGVTETQIASFRKALDDILVETQNTLGTPVQGQVNPMIRKQVINAVQGLDSAFTDSKLAAIAKANVDRDFALLNYSHRYNFDHYLSLVMPFSFWQVATTKNMAARFLEQPGLPLAYAKYKKMLDESETDPGFPDRLRGMMRISLPGAPEWLGDQFIDPIGRALPFRQMMYPLEAMKWAKEGEEGLAPMLGIIGSPSPLITTPINLARKQGKEVGALLPLTRQAKAATAMYKEAGLPGAEKIPAGGVNIEKDILPIRQGLQAIDKTVPDIDQWEDYRIRRMLANMTQLGEVTEQEAIAAMRAKSGPIYDRAVQKVGVEMGAGQLPIAAGAMTIKTYPKGEEELKAVGAELNALATSEAARALGRQPKDLTEAWDTVKSKGLSKKGSLISKWYDDHPAYTVRGLATTAEEDLPAEFASNAIWKGMEGVPSKFQNQLPEADATLLQRWYQSKDPKAFTPEELARLEAISGNLAKQTATPEGAKLQGLAKERADLVETEFARYNGPADAADKYTWLKDNGYTKKGTALYDWGQKNPDYWADTPSSLAWDVLSTVPSAYKKQWTTIQQALNDKFFAVKGDLTKMTPAEQKRLQDLVDDMSILAGTAAYKQQRAWQTELGQLYDKVFADNGGPEGVDQLQWLKDHGLTKRGSEIYQWYQDHPGYGTAGQITTSGTTGSSGGSTYRPYTTGGGGGSYGTTLSQTKAWAQFKAIAPNLVPAMTAFLKGRAKRDPMLLQKLYAVWQKFRPGVSFEAWIRMLIESSGFTGMKA